MTQYLFTSRFGGYSSAPYNELNLAFHVADNALDVRRNREYIDAQLYLPSSKNVVYMNQSHSNIAVEITKEHINLNATNRSSLVENNSGNNDISLDVSADAIYTKIKGVAVAVLVADCLPLLIEIGCYTAAIHVGRVGLLSNIIEITLDAIHEKLLVNKNSELNSELNYSINAILGPAICVNCYKLAPEHFKQIISLPKTDDSNDLHSALRTDLIYDVDESTIDLRASAILRIQNWVKSNSKEINVDIENHDICTHEDINLFSFRRDQITGRFAGIIINSGKYLK